MKIAITGSLGNIGSPLSQQLNNLLGKAIALSLLLWRTFTIGNWLYFWLLPSGTGF